MQAISQSEDISLRVRVDDAERLAVLAQYEIVDTPPEPEFETLVDVIQMRCCVPLASIAFIDRDRMWIKAARGFGVPAVPRSHCFCSVCIHDTPPMIVMDTLLDPRFRTNTLVVDEPRLRFYAGFPIFSQEGYGLGAVCALDVKPRVLNVTQLALLEHARDWVQSSLELRRMDAQPTGCASAKDARLHSWAEAKKQKAWQRVSQFF